MHSFEVLSAAADLLEKPGAWTQKVLARRADGQPANGALDPQATCWCLNGAILKASGRSDYAADAAHKALSREVGGFVFSYNDHPDRTQAEVVKALRNAALAARQMGVA